MPDTLAQRRQLAKFVVLLIAAPVAACQAKEATPSHSSPALGDAAPMSTVAFIEVWKTPTCGCCKMWIEHLEKSGFTVKANDVQQTAPIRTKLRIPDDMGSCHTGLIAGFAIEGHVPASEIKRLLAEPESLRQQVIGLSVPGMPIGSPGMEMGAKRDKYDVMLVLKSGSHRVYQSYSSLA